MQTVCVTSFSVTTAGIIGSDAVEVDIVIAICSVGVGLETYQKIASSVCIWLVKNDIEAIGGVDRTADANSIEDGDSM